MIFQVKPNPTTFDLHGERIHISEVDSLPPEVKAALHDWCKNISGAGAKLDNIEARGQTENWPLVAAIFVALAVLVGLSVRIWWQFT